MDTLKAPEPRDTFSINQILTMRESFNITIYDDLISANVGEEEEQQQQQ